MKKINRWSIYLLGMCMLAAGISLNTKTGLGVAPIITVSFCISEIFNLDFGNMTFLLYALFVIIQLFLIDKSERGTVLLQLIVSLIFSRVLNLFGLVITYNHTLHSLPVNLAVLALAVFFTGTGAALAINMRLYPNPADGVVQTVSLKKGWPQGFTKNIFDICCVAMAALIGIIYTGHVVGIGLGTLLSMVGVGRTIALINKLFQKKMISAAGINPA